MKPLPRGRIVRDEGRVAGLLLASLTGGGERSTILVERHLRSLAATDGHSTFDDLAVAAVLDANRQGSAAAVVGRQHALAGDQRGVTDPQEEWPVGIRSET